MQRRLGLRATCARRIAAVLVHRSFSGCSVLLRNAYKLLGPAPRGPLITPTSLGFNLLVDPRRHRGVDASVYWNGIYEAGTLSVINRSLRPGDTFVDVGANIGLMSLAAAQAVGPGGKVHAFEPMPHLYALLEKNAALNNFRNISAHPVALGSACERRTLYEQRHINQGSASLVRPASGDGASRTVEIDTLDSIADALKPGAIRMVKIDVEGWELEVLRGGQSLLSGKEPPILCVEYSRLTLARGDDPRGICDFLRRVNPYQFFKLKHGKETVSPLVPVSGVSDLPSHDNLFCFLPHHL